MKFLQDNLKLIVVALTGVFVIVLLSVVLSVAFGGEVNRIPIVQSIEGSVMLQRDLKRLNVDKKTLIQSGDIIETSENSAMTLKLDSGKYIYIEPSTTLYIYYTSVADKGSISVNIVNGSVVCRLDKKNAKGESFEIKTPNGCMRSDMSVLRTEFSLKNDYLGYDGVMVTHIQNFSGDATVQLYDAQGEKIDKEMTLAERTSAELITGSALCKYGYLNYDTDLFSLPERTLFEAISINSAGRQTAYSTEELNSALKIKRKYDAVTEEAVTEVTEETSEAVTEPAVTTTSAASEATLAETEPALTEPPVTTLEEVEYTTFDGPKWWEMPNTGDNEMNTEVSQISTLP